MTTSQERDRLITGELETHLAVMERILARGKAAFLGADGMESRYPARDAIRWPAGGLPKLSAAFQGANPRCDYDHRAFRTERGASFQAPAKSDGRTREPVSFRSPGGGARSAARDRVPSGFV